MSEEYRMQLEKRIAECEEKLNSLHIVASEIMKKVNNVAETINKNVENNNIIENNTNASTIQPVKTVTKKTKSAKAKKNTISQKSEKTEKTQKTQKTEKEDIIAEPVHHKLDNPVKYTKLKDFFTDDFNTFNKAYYMAFLEGKLGRITRTNSIYDRFANEEYEHYNTFINMVRKSAGIYKAINF